jgi:UDP-glucuronate 4-epimerase
MKNKKVLITGVAGFIGFHLARKLIGENYNVIGIDNINDYYDVNLKKERLRLLDSKNFTFLKIDITQKSKLNLVFKEYQFQIVFHLAAQAGVRLSFKSPKSYLDSNILGFENIIRLSNQYKVHRFFYASSSSVYGNHPLEKMKEDFCNNYPESLYATTKIFNENLAFTYSSNFKLKTIGLRFFTVYGPYGRPDMAISIFTDAIVHNKQINLNNYGLSYRDYTYVDDVIKSILVLIENSKDLNLFEIFNIGGGEPVQTTELIKIIENNLNKKGKIITREAQIGDVDNTFCDNSKITRLKNLKYHSLEKGISKYIDWYLEYY